MKFTLTFKTPDLYDQLDTPTISNWTENSPDAIDLTKFLERWISYSEYITVEFDTDKHSATVL